MSTATYNRIGKDYAQKRRADPRIEAAILAALGDAESVINVGAGAGSYEPRDRKVLAVEPSETMIRQRPRGAAPCIQATAEALPFESGRFDAAMAVLTIHHWSDWRQGLNEMLRVVRRRVVLLTFDPDESRFWLTDDYFPEIIESDRARIPPLHEVVDALGAHTVVPLAIPHNCADGFLGAYWRRPDVYLDPNVRSAMSCFSRIDATRGLAMLAQDLASGRWRARNARLLGSESIDLGYRLVRADLR